VQPIIVPEGTPLWVKGIIATIAVGLVAFSIWSHLRDRRR